MEFLITKWRDIKCLIASYIFSLCFSKIPQIVVNPSERHLIDEAVEFTINNVRDLIGFLPNKASYLKEKIILEIGPGQDFGIAFVLMGFGAQKIILVDKFLTEWDNSFHAEYYCELLRRAEQEYPGINFNDLEIAIRNNNHVSDKLELLSIGLEDATKIPSESVDVSFSNACFEHLSDPQTAIKELSRITKKGGLGFHQIDFRDHRNYDKPLAFLTMSDFLWNKILSLSEAHFGNRLRYTEFAHFFEGFDFKQRFLADIFADDDYIHQALKYANPKYKKMPVEALRVLSGRFFIEKK